VVDIGTYRGTGSPIKMSRTPATYRLAPPQFAEHTAAILGDYAVDGSRYRAVLPGLDGEADANAATENKIA
jgi:crotonobetainyl-CoA:carnitine CoA-transferase CaiB-like acyl-CoA transferase